MVAQPNVQAQPMRPICGAKTRNGTPCKGIPVKGGNGRCRMHNGKAARGVAAPGFKTGRYSKYLPERLLGRYHEAAQDTQLLELSHEIALLDSRLADLLTRVDSGEAGKLWEKARRLNQDIQKSVHGENYGNLLVASLELDRTIGDAMLDHEAWYEIHAVIDQRRKLAESERKRLVEADQMVKADKALTLAMALLSAVKENVTDRGTLTNIQASFNKLLSAETVDR